MQALRIWLADLSVRFRLPFDKLLHFLVGFAIGAVMLWLTAMPGIGVVSAVVAGIGKEWYDSSRNGLHTPDVEDAVATGVGGLFGDIVLAAMVYVVLL